MLYHECVSHFVSGVGSVDHASSSFHLIWKASLANGLHGDGLPCLNSHKLFGHGIDLNSFPSHRFAFSPSPVQAGNPFSCGITFGIWYALRLK